MINCNTCSEIRSQIPAKKKSYKAVKDIMRTAGKTLIRIMD